MAIKNLQGLRFHRWTVIGFVKVSKWRMAVWLCKCDCGTIKEVSGNSLSMGKSISCGCLVKEIQRKRLTTNPIATKHGLSTERPGRKTRLFRIWMGIKNRLTNSNLPEYPRYGGRGIQMCDGWLDFQNFHKWAMEAGYEDNLSIDRIDSDGNYEPSNCRWVTAKAQANNRRNNVWHTINGETITQSELAERYGISQACLSARLKRGWPLEEALKPVG